jgi:hypothetical protein
MTDREKLIELLKVPIYPHLDADPAEVVADYLLDNGVTFATDTNVGSKWIGVEDMLPEESGTYITAALDGHTTRVTFVKWQKRNRHWELTGARSYWKITHWMPLPEPPREG